MSKKPKRNNNKPFMFYMDEELKKDIEKAYFKEGFESQAAFIRYVLRKAVKRYS